LDRLLKIKMDPRVSSSLVSGGLATIKYESQNLSPHEEDSRGLMVGFEDKLKILSSSGELRILNIQSNQ